MASHSASLPSAKWLALIPQDVGPYGYILCAGYITTRYAGATLRLVSTMGGNV
jgi:hypothetical protein